MRSLAVDSLMARRDDRETLSREETPEGTLWRIGTPRIRDAWISSFTVSRGSGGLGTGVYAYATRTGVREHLDRKDGDPDQPVIALREAHRRPLVVGGDHRTPFDINDLARVMSYIGRKERQDPGYIDSLPDDYSHAREHLPDDPPYRNVGRHVSRLSLNIGGQAPEQFPAYDTDAFYEHVLEACRQAAGQAGSPHDRGFVQPMNCLLWPTFDGIRLTRDAGGDSNKWGCVVFKEKIDSILGRETADHENLDPDTLTEGFAQWGG